MSKAHQDSQDAEEAEVRRLEREVRKLYIAHFSQEQVTWASKKASHHKGRAKQAGCREHFTAWDWLELCAGDDFRCAYCREVAPLEPHHATEIAAGGANTIDNIVPLCYSCHVHWHEHPHDVSDLWLADQQKLFDSFHKGDRVKRHYSCRLPKELVGPRQQGIIAQLFPAQRATPPLRGLIYGKPAFGFCNSHPGTPGYSAQITPTRKYLDRSWEATALFDYGKEWRESFAKARVQWVRTVKGQEIVVNEIIVKLHELEKVEKADPRKA